MEGSVSLLVIMASSRTAEDTEDIGLITTCTALPLASSSSWRGWR